MANLTAIIGADTSKFVSGIKSAQEMLNKFVKDTNSASESTKQNINATDEQVVAYKRVVKELEKVGNGSMTTSKQQRTLTEQIKELKVQWQNLSNSAKSSDFGKSMSDTIKLATEELSNLKKQLSSLDESDAKPMKLTEQLERTTSELQLLTAQYRALSAAEKSSPFGVELSSKIDTVRKKAGDLKDTISDVEREISAKSSDTQNLDVFNEALGIGADLISTYSSLVAKLTGDEEKLKNAIATIAAVQSAANLSTKIANALQSSSVIMLKTRQIQENAAALAIKIRTAAEGKGTLATKAATAAQTAFNLVAKANPYVLLATAIVAAIGGIVAFSKKTNEDTEAQKKHNDALQKSKQKFDDYAKSVGDKGADLIASYSLLKEAYKNLKSEHQKLQWIKNNKDEFDNLGLKVNDLTDAENVFVNNTDAVVQALKKRAEAAAKQAQLTELSAQLLEEQTKADAAYKSKKVKAGDVVGGSSHSTAGGNEFVNNKGQWVYTEKGAKEANQRIKRDAFATVDSIQTRIDGLAKSLATTLTTGSSTSSNKGGSGSTTTEEAPMAGSLAEAKEKVAELKKELESLNPNDTRFNEIKSQLEAWTKVESELNEKIYGTNDAVETVNNEVAKLVSGSLAEANEYVKTLTEKIENMSVDDSSFAETLELLNQWKKKQEEISKSINGTEEAYQSLSDSDSVNTFVEKLGNVSKISDGVVGSINNIYEAFKNLSSELENAENGWESMFAVFSTGMTLLDNFASIVESITTLTQLFTAAKKGENAQTDLSIQKSTKNIGVKAGETAANITAAGSEGADAAAKAGKSVADIPYVGPILAVAAIASVMAAIISMIASAKSFATGGIIEGASNIGDYNIARVNNGEMILNGTQQKRLFNLLDGNSFGSTNSLQSGQVEFKIKGTELIGCINNVNKKRSKV